MEDKQTPPEMQNNQSGKYAPNTFIDGECAEHPHNMHTEINNIKFIRLIESSIDMFLDNGKSLANNIQPCMLHGYM